MQELLAHARDNPGKVTFGVPNGAPPHMLAEMFRLETQADVMIVPYRGASTLITDMIAGRIHAGFETTSVMFGHLNDNKIRGLAVVRSSRIPQISDVPTMSESGVKGIHGSSWIGVVAPRGTPPAITSRLREEILKGVQSAEVTEKLKMFGSEPRPMSEAEFAEFIASEYVRIGNIMRASRTKAE